MINELPSIAEAGARFRAGQMSPLELVDACLSRIEARDARIRAWVSVDGNGAREMASALGELLRRGTDLGPLHGIPVAIKDLIDVAGWPTRAGSALRESHRAQRDAAVVRRLRRAGAIVLGKTVTTEFACFDPPPTRNPWNLAHTPGGSSSGSAAALASEMVPLALGSQTGGSITRPAAYCGVCGLKPTAGAVSAEGVVPISPYLDHVGPLARSVADLQLAWNVIGPGAGGSKTDDRNGAPPWPVLLRPIEDYFLEQAASDVAENFRTVVAELIPRSVEPLGLPPSFGDVHRCHRVLMAVGAADTHRELFELHGPAFGPHVRGLIEEGRATTAVDFSRALRHQEEFRAAMGAMLGDRWIAMTPATTCVAPASLQTTGDPRFNSPWSYSGLPTVTIPCGLNGQGMPFGLQLIAGPHCEADLLAAAAWCERRLKFSGRPECVRADKDRPE